MIPIAWVLGLFPKDLHYGSDYAKDGDVVSTHVRPELTRREAGRDDDTPTNEHRGKHIKHGSSCMEEWIGSVKGILCGQFQGINNRLRSAYHPSVRNNATFRRPRGS